MTHPGTLGLRRPLAVLTCSAALVAAATPAAHARAPLTRYHCINVMLVPGSIGYLGLKPGGRYETYLTRRGRASSRGRFRQRGNRISLRGGSYSGWWLLDKGDRAYNTGTFRILELRNEDGYVATCQEVR